MKTRTGKVPASAGQDDALLTALESRFAQHPQRHPDLAWTKVRARLEARPDKLRSLAEMERTGGEPDIVGQDAKTGEFIFVDCAAQSPAGRTGLCYDQEGLDSRKEHKPSGNVVDMAAKMGVELLTEEEYFALQQLGEFDTKSSSWIRTPPEIRQLGGALYCDRRYGRVFVGHNGAQSYYSGRGFRGALRV